MPRPAERQPADPVSWLEAHRALQLRQRLRQPSKRGERRPVQVARHGIGAGLDGRVQILERGVNLVWLNRDGDAAPPVYAAGLYESQPRYVIAASAPPLPAYTLLRAQP